MAVRFVSDTEGSSSIDAAPSGRKLVKPRAETVDIVRGVALLGILFINIMTFRSTDQNWTTLDRAADILSLILAHGKFVAMFIILFGVSFSFQVENADAQRFMPQYLRRMVGLALLGTLHFVFLWEGDILMQYVVPGVLLLLFLRRPVRTVLIGAGVSYGLLLAFMLTVVITTASMRSGQSTGAGGDPTVSSAIYQHGSYGEVVEARLELLPSFLEEHLITSVLLLGTFLLGVYIGKQGYLTHPQDHERLLRRVVSLTLPIGLLMNIVTVLGDPYRNSLPLALQIGYYFCTLAGPTVLSLGYVAGAALLASRWTWLKPLAAVGRMTLTNYLMQSLILATLFYGYGFGLYDKVNPAPGIALIVVLFALQVIFSVWWMRRFRYGPVEWLWRSFTYWQAQPIRRSARPPLTPRA